MRWLLALALVALSARAEEIEERPGWKVIASPEGWFAYPVDEKDAEAPGTVSVVAAPAPGPAPVPGLDIGSRSPTAAAQPAREGALPAQGELRSLPAPAADACVPLRDLFAQRLYQLRGVDLSLPLAGWARENLGVPGLGMPPPPAPWHRRYPFVTGLILDPLALSALGFDLTLRRLAEDLAACE